MRIAAEPIVIAHRGASGYRPEHTLAAYELAIQMGADFIEPDLVSTKDGVLVARHENAIAILAGDVVLEATTDVASRSEYADRLTTKIVDGESITGWFTEDFTLAELKTLRAIERMPRLRGTAFDGMFEIPTFGEILELATRQSTQSGRAIGIYPETKHPTYFDAIGLSLEEPLLAALRENEWDRSEAPVFIQSFETANLRGLREITDVRLIQLLSRHAPYDFVASGDSRTYADLVTPEGLRWIAGYADGVGPDKDLIVPRDTAGRLIAPSTLIRDAHEAGLLVHAWTFRSENFFLPAQFVYGDSADPDRDAMPGDAAAEYALFFGLGVDGVFTDHPDAAVAARARTSS